MEKVFLEKINNKINISELEENTILIALYYLSHNGLIYVVRKKLKNYLRNKRKFIITLNNLINEDLIDINGAKDVVLTDKGIVRIHCYIESTKDSTTEVLPIKNINNINVVRTRQIGWGS